MMGKNQHVVRRKEGWAVRGEGNQRDTALCGTQTEAIRTAIKIAKNYGGELLVHDRQGRIRERNSFGHDPCPPRGDVFREPQHVIKRADGRWSVRSSGTSRPSRTFLKWTDAIAYATTIAKKNSSGLYIHAKDGMIREYNSFGDSRRKPARKR
jgi:hypothetical protein